MATPSKKFEICAEKKGSTAAATSLAAILPEVVGQGFEGVVIGAVEHERPLVAAVEQTRDRQPLQVMAQRRSGQVDVVLDLSRWRALRIALDDEPQDGQAGRVPQRAQLLGVLVEFARHGPFLLISKHASSGLRPGSAWKGCRRQALTPPARSRRYLLDGGDT